MAVLKGTDQGIVIHHPGIVAENDIRIMGRDVFAEAGDPLE